MKIIFALKIYKIIEVGPECLFLFTTLSTSTTIYGFENESYNYNVKFQLRRDRHA